MIFEKLVVHRAVVHKALRVHHFGRVALGRGKNFALGVFVLFGSWFLSTSSMTASSITSVFEESCCGF